MNKILVFSWAYRDQIKDYISPNSLAARRGHVSKCLPKISKPKYCVGCLKREGSLPSLSLSFILLLGCRGDDWGSCNHLGPYEQEAVC